MSFLDLAQSLIDAALVVYLWRASRPKPPQRPILLDPSAPRKRRAGGVVVRRTFMAFLLVSWPVQAQAQSVTTRVPSNCTDAQVLGGTATGTGVECQADATGTDDQVASEVGFTPAGTIAATDVQAAIEEVASEAGGTPSAISAGDSSATVTDAGTGSFTLALDAGTVFALTTGGVATVGRTNTGGTLELQDGNVTLRDAGGNDLVIEADNVDTLRINNLGFRILAGVFMIDPQASAPATCTAARDIYTDTSGALCWCSTTNTWENLSTTGSCA